MFLIEQSGCVDFFVFPVLSRTFLYSIFLPQSRHVGEKFHELTGDSVTGVFRSLNLISASYLFLSFEVFTAIVGRSDSKFVDTGLKQSSISL